MPITVQIELTDADMALLLYIDSLRRTLTHNPRRHQVCGYPGRRALPHQKADQHAFERLKLLHLVIHSPAGFCWLSDEAKKLIP